VHDNFQGREQYHTVQFVYIKNLARCGTTRESIDLRDPSQPQPSRIYPVLELPKTSKPYVAGKGEPNVNQRLIHYTFYFLFQIEIRQRKL
jgi:hypothetical protein